MKRISLRILGIDMAIKGADFIEMFRFFMDAGQNETDSLTSAQRVFRGAPVTGGVAFTKDAVNLHAFYPHTFSLGAEEPAHGAVPEPVCWQARAARRVRAGAVFRQRL